jgi:hypothetical protein
VTEPSKIPFRNWVAIPRWIFTAERSGDLTEAEAHALKALYERASTKTWIVTARDLDHLASLLAWRHTPDYLSRVLSGLRDRAFISYETKPGSTHHPYRIRLLHLSEHGPSRIEEASPSSTQAPTGAVEPDSELGRVAESEQPQAHLEQAGPSSGGGGPSSEHISTPVVERDSGVHAREPVRAALDASGDTKPSSTEEAKGPASVLDVARTRNAEHEADRLIASLPSRTRADREPVHIIITPLDQEAETLLFAEVETLLTTGAVEPFDEPPLCRFHTHGGNDWRGHDGRLHCRTCHPPAPGAAR